MLQCSSVAAAAASFSSCFYTSVLMQVSGEEYGEEELDPEWMALLADLDARLQVGAGRGAAAAGQLLAGCGAQAAAAGELHALQASGASCRSQCERQQQQFSRQLADNAVEQLPPAAQLLPPPLL